MNGRAARIIHSYAATFAHLGGGAGRNMERIAKRNYRKASKKEKRSMLNMMEREAAKRRHHAAQDG